MKKFECEDYDLILSYIYNMYREYSENWEQDNANFKINMKKMKIKDIYYLDTKSEGQLDLKFKRNLYSFKNGLDELLFDISYNIDKIKINKNIKITSRTKTEESLINKIFRKKKVEDGSISINKYLNDLLGFRIIDPYYQENIDAIIQLLESYKKNGMKITHMFRQNDNYKGYHIYYKSSNFTFPMEIQIWDKCNEQKNIQLHKVYKQGYVDTIINKYNYF